MNNTKRNNGINGSSNSGDRRAPQSAPTRNWTAPPTPPVMMKKRRGSTRTNRTDDDHDGMTHKKPRVAAPKASLVPATNPAPAKTFSSFSVRATGMGTANTRRTSSDNSTGTASTASCSSSSSTSSSSSSSSDSPSTTPATICIGITTKGTHCKACLKRGGGPCHYNHHAYVYLHDADGQKETKTKKGDDSAPPPPKPTTPAGRRAAWQPDTDATIDVGMTDTHTFCMRCLHQDGNCKLDHPNGYTRVHVPSREPQQPQPQPKEKRSTPASTAPPPPPPPPPPPQPQPKSQPQSQPKEKRPAPASTAPPPSKRGNTSDACFANDDDDAMSISSGEYYDYYSPHTEEEGGAKKSEFACGNPPMPSYYCEVHNGTANGNSTPIHHGHSYHGTAPLLCPVNRPTTHTSLPVDGTASVLKPTKTTTTKMTKKRTKKKGKVHRRYHGTGARPCSVHRPTTDTSIPFYVAASVPNATMTTTKMKKKMTKKKGKVHRRCSLRLLRMKKKQELKKEQRQRRRQQQYQDHNRRQYSGNSDSGSDRTPRGIPTMIHCYEQDAAKHNRKRETSSPPAPWFTSSSSTSNGEQKNEPERSSSSSSSFSSSSTFSSSTSSKEKKKEPKRSSSSSSSFFNANRNRKKKESNKNSRTTSADDGTKQVKGNTKHAASSTGTGAKTNPITDCRGNKKGTTSRNNGTQKRNKGKASTSSSSPAQQPCSANRGTQEKKTNDDECGKQSGYNQGKNGYKKDHTTKDSSRDATPQQQPPHNGLASFLLFVIVLLKVGIILCLYAVLFWCVLSAGWTSFDRYHHTKIHDKETKKKDEPTKKSDIRHNCCSSTASSNKKTPASTKSNNDGSNDNDNGKPNGSTMKTNTKTEKKLSSSNESTKSEIADTTNEKAKVSRRVHPTPKVLIPHLKILEMLDEKHGRTETGSMSYYYDPEEVSSKVALKMIRKRLLLKYHPDKNRTMNEKSANERTQQINNAFIEIHKFNRSMGIVSN